MHWVTFFSVEDHPWFSDPAAAAGLLLIAGVGVALMFHREAPLPAGGYGVRLIGAVVCTGSVAFLAFILGVSHYQHASLVRAIRSGEAHVVEGEIVNFRPMPEGGHQPESFDVGKEHFEYGDYVDEGGFNESSTYGGPIHSGERVRITHLKGVILRLQIAQ